MINVEITEEQEAVKCPKCNGVWTKGNMPKPVDLSNKYTKPLPATCPHCGVEVKILIKGIGTQVNPADAVFMFAAWLTTRKEKTVISSSNDASPIAKLCEKFCEANDLKLSKEYPDNLKHPTE